jgi:hypothetical protein
MKILIHGRKDGYNILYPQPTPNEFYAFASDIQSISANDNILLYGKDFYTLAFADGGCIFTKYIFGHDSGRSQLGEIGISIFVPNIKKLSGGEVKQLLDELIHIYSTNYINDNQIIDPQNGFNWSLFTSAANFYDAKLQPRESKESVAIGTQDAAYHYYKSNEELIKHFNKPFQEEYGNFKQILFIDNNLQGTANPLNVLKNSGVEVNPDLSKYKLKGSINNETTITAFYNNQRNNVTNFLSDKWKIRIEYKKEYHELLLVEDEFAELKNKYLEIVGDNEVKVKYNVLETEAKKSPEAKTIHFIVQRKKDGEQIIGAEIQVDTQPWQKETSFTFEGDELGKKHRISARKENFKGHIDIVPKDNDNTEPLTIKLQEHKLVKFTGKFEDQYLPNIKVSIP